MIITRYKAFFSVSTSYELAALGVRTDGMTVEPTAGTEQKIDDLKLRVKNVDNSSTIYFEGIEQPVGAPTTSEPVVESTTDEDFYFLVYFSNKEKITGLKFHSTAGIAKAIGFPVLFDAKVINPGAVPTVAAREDVKVMPPVFSISMSQNDTGLASEYASLEIRDESNALVDLGIMPVALDGPTGIGEFNFSVDASVQPPGIYEFKVGTFTRKYFLATGMELGQSIAIIRVIKNNLLPYRKSLADPGFAKFDLVIPKA